MPLRIRVAVFALLVAPGCGDQSRGADGSRARAGEPLAPRATTGPDVASRVLLDSLTSRASDLYARGEYDSARVSYEAALPVATASPAGMLSCSSPRNQID